MNEFMTVKEASERWGVKTTAIREKLNIKRRPALKQELEWGIVKYNEPKNGKKYGEWLISVIAMKHWYGDELSELESTHEPTLKEFPRKRSNTLDILDLDVLAKITSKKVVEVLEREFKEDLHDYRFRTFYKLDAFGNVYIWATKSGVISLKKYIFYKEDDECVASNAFTALDAAVLLKIFNNQSAVETNYKQL